MTFVVDKNIQKIAEAYAADAVDFARTHFAIELDGSDQSIEKIEAILDEMHKQSLQAKPSDEKIYQFAKCFGGYIGEVYRHNHGATWGIVTLDDNSFPGMYSALT